jgi:addiction module HigA family antidote
MGVRRENLSLVIHGQIGISPKMALALERVGISNAEFWMRRQAGYELAQERLRQERERSAA